MSQGPRVRLARDLLGATQKALAAEVGVSQPTWARIEAGTVALTPEVIGHLAARTGLADSFFTADIDIAPLGESGTMYFREHSRLTVRERSRAASLAKLAMYALEVASSRGVRLPPLVLPAPDTIDRSDVERAAALTREALGLHQHEPVGHLTRKLEKAGVRVLSIPVTYDASKVERGIDAFSDWIDGEAIAATSQHGPGDRLRMSLAHEVGHLVLHPRGGNEDTLEHEARHFAAALLMPLEAFTMMVPPRPMTVTDLGVLKRHWRVSMAAVVMRAATVGAIDSAEKTRLFRVLGARGWRRSEPIEIPRERTALLASALRRAFGTTSAQTLARHLHLNPSIVAGLFEQPEDLGADVVDVAEERWTARRR
ncbi:XRE family transcriptional regulator [Euzebya pacifica]|uniref:XRE family transcriptional regulator n=1 Tax=Euzebya pacifica TaxID=1608957 RepID=UPI0030F94090